MSTATLRLAEIADAPRLREVMRDAKARWGHDPERVAAWAASEDVAGRLAGEEWVVAELDGRLVGWAALRTGADGAVLEDLWVEPPATGRGVGRELFGAIADRARALGYEALEWESEPEALGFYERMGGVAVGERTSSWGTRLPQMRLELE